MEKQLLTDEYVGKAFSELKGLSGTSQDGQFEKALDQLIELATENRNIKLAPPIQPKSRFWKAGRSPSDPQAQLISPLQRTAAATGLLYTHQSISSVNGLQLTETQKIIVDKAIRTLVKQEDRQFTLNFQNLLKLYGELRGTKPLVAH
ncbi:hypothetical protein O181_072781 [Austropuccinia psidii MF-1]|uniref:Uncharacterized protein n=1 Tax=Austropuccinia psidii MF-1 TaxID=1389203 RepID=A0A9Q3I7P7_9BASI|nr:hypothetical protein [Austropuccinia psidii MF-1]